MSCSCDAVGLWRVCMFTWVCKKKYKKTTQKKTTKINDKIAKQKLKLKIHEENYNTFPARFRIFVNYIYTNTSNKKQTKKNIK